MKMKFWICLMMLVPSAADILDMSGKMFTFPEETKTAHVRLSPRPTRYTAITVCHRSFTGLARIHGLFSLATSSIHNEFLTFFTEQICPSIHNKGACFGKIDYTPNKWHSTCMTWDSISGVAQVWFDGQPLTKRFFYDRPILGRPIVVLGQDQDSYGGGFVTTESFVGMMTDVHMWNYVLSSCEIQKYMKEKIFTPGNVLNWAALDFQIRGRVLIENKQTDCSLDCGTD